MIKDVLYNHPIRWLASIKGLQSNYMQQTPNNSGIWDGITYKLNEKTASCDYWVVHGDLDATAEVKVNAATVFILSEEVEQRVWDKKFLAQFDHVIGTQEHVPHPDYTRCHCVCPWQVNKSYSELIHTSTPVKTKQLSAIISDTTLKEGHKKRFAFANQLKGHFKERLDWYGRGNMFIENKWDALADYEYSIAIENSVHKHYWTEKIADCLLAYTIPFYFGCPNIFDYFPEGSVILLNPDSLEESISIIENAIANDHYKHNFAALEEARRRVLNEFQFFPAITHVLKHLDTSKTSQIARKVTLRPESHFTKELLVKRIVRKIRQVAR